MKSLSRVALGAIFTECNELGSTPIDIAAFKRYELCRGSDLLSIESGVVGGMLEILRTEPIEPVPILFGSACPGGPLTRECYDSLRFEFLERLQDMLPVDGVLFPFHGAAAAEHVGDIEGDLLRETRNLVGPHTPIVATLDLHAHVTTEMVRHADTLLAWETYPHRDTFETGQRGARMMVDILGERINPTMAMAKVPVVTGAFHGATEGDGPFARIMRMAKSYERGDGVLSTSAILIHPHLDQPNMGSGAIAITDDDEPRAVQIAQAIAESYWEARQEFEASLLRPAVAIQQGLQVDGQPILLLEVSDCCGGGASGDSVAVLKALLDADTSFRSLVPVVDSQAALACHEVGLGAILTLSIGHRLAPKWGKPIEVRGEVRTLSDGRFTYSGGIWSGTVGEMGPTAVLRINTVDLLIASHPTYDWADEQFRSVGLDPNEAKFLVVKNPMNYRNTYGSIAKGIFVLDTPGPTPASVKDVSFRRLKRPFFPADKDIPGLTPEIFT